MSGMIIGTQSVLPPPVNDTATVLTILTSLPVFSGPWEWIRQKWQDHPKTFEKAKKVFLDKLRDLDMHISECVEVSQNYFGAKDNQDLFYFLMNEFVPHMDKVCQDIQSIAKLYRKYKYVLNRFSCLGITLENIMGTADTGLLNDRDYVVRHVAKVDVVKRREVLESMIKQIVTSLQDEPVRPLTAYIPIIEETEYESYTPPKANWD